MMRRASVITVALMVTVVLSVSVDAGVRDPISRKFQPENGFFETKQSGSKVRSGVSSQPVIKTQGKASVPKKSYPWRAPWSR